MRVAFVFPGQGSQKTGMCKELYDEFTTAREVFQEVDDALGFALTNIIFDEKNIEQLTLTKNTQPALMTASVAIMKTILGLSGKNITEFCAVFAGHSLGEYTALCNAGVLSLQDTARLLHLRGKLMESACPSGSGGMAACFGITNSALDKLIGDLEYQHICQIANDNVEGQVVISGKNEAVDEIIKKLESEGYRAIKLNVSGPFHSRLMQDVVEPMKEAIHAIDFKTACLPIVANVTADVQHDPNEIKANLLEQICGTVRWRESMHKLSALGIDTLVEIGPGRVLTGLAKRSSVKFSTMNVSNLDELEQFLKLTTTQYQSN